jgi:hypothetical protein
MHSTGSRLAAAMNNTWPVATNEIITCVCAGLTVIMCGRTRFAPVRERQSSGTSPPRSIRSLEGGCLRNGLNPRAGVRCHRAVVLNTLLLLELVTVRVFIGNFPGTTEDSS